MIVKLRKFNKDENFTITFTFRNVKIVNTKNRMIVYYPSKSLIEFAYNYLTYGTDFKDFDNKKEMILYKNDMLQIVTEGGQNGT